jgi:5-(carboxyamino)imidazole ribonucleotide synthase
MKAKTLGIVGGGQLGRMLTLAAHDFGINVVVLNPEPNGPAAQVGAKEIVAGFYDKDAIRELAAQSDWLTYEIEHVDAQLLEEIKASGKPVAPDPSTLKMIQDKYAQKEFLSSHNIPVAPYQLISTEREARIIWAGFERRMFIKTRYGGYDGRGNFLISQSKSAGQIGPTMAKLSGVPVYAEKFVGLRKELAVMVAKGADGSTRVYPVAETIHARSILQMAICPAPVNDVVRFSAERMALSVVELLEGPGMFCVEMFLTANGRLLVNEIAPRVHNSGHLTIEANRTSQFEQHVRAVTGLPLGDVDLRTGAAVMVNILGARNGDPEPAGIQEALEIPGLSIHMYGKSPTKIDRKMGHYTVTSRSVRDARRRAEAARKKISI